MTGPMTFPVCSNPECSPLAPMTGTRLQRVTDTDTTTLRCPICKREYDADIRTESHGLICACGATLIFKRTWYLKCPKCGRRY